MFAHSHISSPLIPLAYFRTHIENPSFDTLLFTFKTCDCCWLAKVSDFFVFGSIRQIDLNLAATEISSKPLDICTGFPPRLYYWPIIIDPLLALVCVWVCRLKCTQRTLVCRVYIFCAHEMLLALIPTASWCVLEYIRQFSLLYRSYSLCVYVFSMLVVFGKGLNQIRNPLQCRRATRENQVAPASRRRRGIRTRRLTKQCRNSAAKAVNKVTTHTNTRTAVDR